MDEKPYIDRVEWLGDHLGAYFADEEEEVAIQDLKEYLGKDEEGREWFKEAFHIILDDENYSCSEFLRKYMQAHWSEERSREWLWKLRRIFFPEDFPLEGEKHCVYCQAPVKS